MTLVFVPFDWQHKDGLYIQEEIDECVKDIRELLDTCEFIQVENILYTTDSFTGVGMGFRGPTLCYKDGLYDWFYRINGGFKKTEEE